MRTWLATSRNSWATESTSDWLTDLDRLLSNHYPIKTRDALSPKAVEAYPQAGEVLKVVEEWLAEFMGAEQSIANWSSAIEGWLEVLYTVRKLGMRTEEETVQQDADDVIEPGNSKIWLGY